MAQDGGTRSRPPVPQRLLAEATRLFAERGFDRTSVQEIVEAAGVTKGALYHYFGSKDDLLHEVYARVLRCRPSAWSAIAAGTQPVADRLRQAAADVVVTSIQNLDDTKIFFRSMHQLSPEKQKAVRAERRRYHERFRSLVEEGQPRRRLPGRSAARPGRGLLLRLGAPPRHLVPPGRSAVRRAGRRPVRRPAAALGAAALTPRHGRSTGEGMARPRERRAARGDAPRRGPGPRRPAPAGAAAGAGGRRQLPRRDAVPRRSTRSARRCPSPPASRCAARWSRSARA